jgi:hypothetical protein
MTATELATCLVPVGPGSLAPVEGIIVVCAAIYERRFGLSSHQFLISLLWSYCLELHHLTPLGILHIAAFITLCEAYIGIEPPLNLRNHFFEARLWYDLGTGAASLGSVDTSVCSSPRADSYFSILQHEAPIRWRKAWFLLKDEANAPLTTFMGSCPVPHPNWEHGVAQADFTLLQPLLEIVWGLRQKGLTSKEIMRTFLSRFASERQLWGCLQGQVVSFALPHPPPPLPNRGA